MFDQTFVNTQTQTRRPWTVVASLILQILFVTAAVLVPLFHLESIHAVTTTTMWMPLQPAPHPSAPEAHPAVRTPAARRQISTNALIAPTRIPAHIDMTADAPDVASPPVLPSTGLGGPLSAIITPPAPPVAKQTPAPPAEPAAPVRISMGTQAAKLIFGPKPLYPALARTARIQGTVKIQAIISREGAIGNLQVVSGPPLLVSAAIAAVQQWRYQPTLLNSEPVEVATEIEVTFTLN
jgi:protein TonB